MKLKDLPLTSANIMTYVGDEKKGLYVVSFTNIYALIISPYEKLPNNLNPGIKFNCIAVGNKDMRAGNYGGAKISTYNSSIVIDGKPTQESFFSFYEDCYATSTIFTMLPFAGIHDLRAEINSDCVFLPSIFEKNGTSTNNVGTSFYTINVNPTYTYREFIKGSMDTQTVLQEAVISNKVGFFKHYLYVNGGKFNTTNNYSVTEVIESSDENSIKWVSNEKSKLFCYKYESAHDIEDVWECPLNSKKLNVTKDSAFSSVMSKNSVSQLEQNVAFMNTPFPFFSYELIPRFLLNGSVFTGNHYTIDFPALLPSSSEEVNNTWANVKKVGENTDANNEVIVLYGDPPIAQTSDEQQREDNINAGIDDSAQDNGESSTDSESKTPSSADITYGDTSGSASELTKLYAISSEQLNLLGENLWSQKYFDVLRIQDNPIENVISIKKFPFSITGVSESIKIGNVDLGVNAERLTVGVHKLKFGPIKIGGKYGNFLDFEPFTNLKICLPYIGFYDLPISELMNSLLEVEYLVDLIHGDCTAIVKKDTYPLYEFNGNMGVNVPLTQTDRVSAETKHIQNVVSATVSGASTSGLARGLVGLGTSMIESGLTSYNSSHTASGSGAVNLAGVQNVRLIYNRPATILKKENGSFVPYPNNYRHTHGLPCNNARKISDLTGFFKCGENIDLSNIAATKEIKDMIISYLQGGVYV